jgi:hypothetical protein
VKAALTTMDKYWLYNPTTITIIIWLSCFSLYFSGFVNYGAESSNLFWALLLSAVGLFLGNQFAVLKIGSLKSKTIRTSLSERVQSQEISILRAYRTLILITVIGLGFLFVSLLIKVPLSVLFTNPDYVKNEVERAYWGSLFVSAVYPAQIFGCLLSFCGSKKNFSYLFVPLLLTLIYMITYWGRLPVLIDLIVISGVWFISDLSKGNKKLKIARLMFYSLATVMVLLVFMSWTIEFRIKSYSDSYNGFTNAYTPGNVINDFIKENSKIFGSFRSLQISYNYAIAGIPTTSYYLGKESEMAFGQACIPYIYRFGHSLGILPAPVLSGDRMLGDGLQVCSMIGFFYIDLGYIGLIAGIFIFAYVSSYNYYKFLLTNSLGSMCWTIWTFVLGATSMQCFLFSNSQYVYAVIITFLILKIYKLR